MEKSCQFNQEQKLVILESAKEVGIKEASRIAGAHYTTVYEWRNRLEVLAGMDFCHTVLRVGAGDRIRRFCKKNLRKSVTQTCRHGIALGKRILMNLPAASCGVSKTSRNEASLGEYNPKRFKRQILLENIS